MMAIRTFIMDHLLVPSSINGSASAAGAIEPHLSVPGVNSKDWVTTISRPASPDYQRLLHQHSLILPQIDHLRKFRSSLEDFDIRAEARTVIITASSSPQGCRPSRFKSPLRHANSRTPRGISTLNPLRHVPSSDHSREQPNQEALLEAQSLRPGL